MKNLSTKYLGLELKNPVVVGSCGLTHSADKIKELADNGAAAVVLKSLFEEQIQAEFSSNLDSYATDYPGAVDYVREYTRSREIQEYLDLIHDVKKAVDIPVIGSIHCIYGDEWVAFAGQMEEAGADALELNISLLPSDLRLTSEESEKRFFEIIDRVGEKVTLPTALKISHFSASLANFIAKLSWHEKVSGLVLFNRFYMPDIDIDQISLKSSNVLSSPEEISTSLRWIALMSGRIEKDLAASTGVHDHVGLVKQLLAGAAAVQVVSTLYNNGASQIRNMLEGLENWMEEKSFDSLDDFRGRLSYKEVDDPAVFERIQFMKYYAGLS